MNKIWFILMQWLIRRNSRWLVWYVEKEYKRKIDYDKIKASLTWKGGIEFRVMLPTKELFLSSLYYLKEYDVSDEYYTKEQVEEMTQQEVMKNLDKIYLSIPRW